MNIDEIFLLETKLWEAIRDKDRNAFLGLLDEDAVIFSGGYQYSGTEYADTISELNCKSFSIDYIEIVNEDIESVQIVYQITVEADHKNDPDPEEAFNITTTWRRKDGRWLVVFRMDQRSN